jgi:hypothetical protein
LRLRQRSRGGVEGPNWLSVFGIELEEIALQANLMDLEFGDPPKPVSAHSRAIAVAF